MSISVESGLPQSALQIMMHCYKFVDSIWQHVDREPIPDQGFELRFRESCVKDLIDWNISQQREMHLGCNLQTASGVCHEVDIVAKSQDLIAILELKNRQGSPPEKNDVIVFFAKIFDYLALNPTLLLSEIIPIFMSNTQFEVTGLAACMGLGIHPIAPGLRPLPILHRNAKIMDYEISNGLEISPKEIDSFNDFCATLNRITLNLNETWLTTRCGYLSEERIVLHAVGERDTHSICQEFLQLNNECTRLLSIFRMAKSGVSK